ncbi:DUF5941 domain-containing protein [Spongiactinospora sp. TRM90649]|uniref:DUF5941 domain-containing protein n=1 Tax=Spongiactinospora sp. TRM90649 TaxID=3031114 RepID=UPI0023F797B4|nr:DUF5941 domain-containing protein [Spongiactinospora sp. TRM90649]MDF5754147.1 DUF5941 domain-containing protein [Spongiactinospora sp. TRM90649]
MITHPQQSQVATPDPDEERRRIQTARLLAYRDDGPLLRPLRRVLKGGLPPAPAALASLVAVAAIGAAGLLEPGPMLLVPVLVMVALVGPTAPRDHLGRFDWLAPPLVRGGEFLVLLLVGITAGAPKWLLFVMIYVVGYHTYDTVYRTRQSIWPPDWLFMAGLGWEVRLILVGVGAALGVATWVIAALTLYLGVLFAVESVTSWVRLDKASAQGAESDDLEASPEEAQEQTTGDAERG